MKARGLLRRYSVNIYGYGIDILEVIVEAQPDLTVDTCSILSRNGVIFAFHHMRILRACRNPTLGCVAIRILRRRFVFAKPNDPAAL